MRRELDFGRYDFIVSAICSLLAHKEKERNEGFNC